MTQASVVLSRMQDLIVPYDPVWATSFLALRDHLQGLFGGLQADIQHVGSTSIPGLPSKPILDIDVIIDHVNLLPLISRRLEQAGYEARGDQGVPDRYAFRQRESDVPWTNERRTWMAHHVYVCLAGSLALKNHLCFRDTLMADPALLDAYGQLKMTIAQTPGMDRQRYSRAKTGFILQVLAGKGFSAADIAAIEAANR
jgi:GrpB-like predicted nucleotidyltransferase (UPF0157 family)